MEEKESILTKYLKKYFWWISLSVVLSVGQNYLNLQLPLLLQPLVDDILINQQWDQLTPLYLKLLLIFLFSGIFSLFRTLIVQYIGTNVVYEVRNDIFRALQALSYSFFDKNRTGDIMSKATSDVNQVRNFLSQQFGNLIRDSITLFVILFLVFRINWQLSMIFLALVPILFVMMIWYRRNMFKAYVEMSRKSGTLTSTLQENITGVRVVKAFAREEHENKKFKKDNDEFLKKNMRIIRINTIYGPLQEFVTSIGAVLLLFLGGILVLNGKMTVGEVAAFFAMFQFLYDPIRSIVNIYSQFSQTEGAMVRINSILEYKSEITEKEDAIVLEDMKGHYKFEDVWFSYEGDSHYALKGLNFEVRPGERIAILGATGSGKSTLINLIPRFYDPTKGRILIDDVDLRDLKIDEYRRQIGIVSQDIFLFARSIRDNIAYGAHGLRIKQEEIERVAKIAAIHNFIISLPDGYKTLVGERGHTLSGGQKQRIAIARALLTNPKILILDDSLSAVDIDTEAQIQKALDQLYQNRTTFIITQRISTIQNCDRILVLDYGEIKELGTHDELYEMGGIYRRVYDTMFKAQTKAADDRAAELAKVKVPFEGVFPSDAKTIEDFYEAKYPNPARRERAQQRKTAQIKRKIAKEKGKEERAIKNLEKEKEKEQKRENKRESKREQKENKREQKENKREQKENKREQKENKREQKELRKEARILKKEKNKHEKQESKIITGGDN